jgi:anti-sigma factor RsiW
MNTPFHDDPDLWASAAATGGLSSTDLAQWREHIAACPSCQRLHDEEIAMHDLLTKTFEPASPDAGFEQRIIRNLRQGAFRQKQPWYGFLLLHPLLATAATASILLGAFALFAVKPVRKDQLAAQSPAPGIFTGLSAPAIAAIKAQAAGMVISGIEKNNDNGDLSYTVTTGAPGAEPSHFTMSDEGRLVSIDRASADIPAPVRDAIATQAGANRVEGIEQDFDDGSYVATIAFPDGRERDYTFDSNGALTDVETDLAELPAATQAAIKSRVGGGSMESVDRIYDTGAISYVVTMTGTDGMERDYTFAEDGTLSSIEAFLNELPPTVQSAVKSQVGRGRLDGVDQSFEDGTISYEATMTDPVGRERDFSVSTDGSLLTREVAVAETPQQVQRTISQTLGNAKLIEVCQTFDDPNGMVPYEIEASVNGRPLYFLVGQNGDFLGTED